MSVIERLLRRDPGEAPPMIGGVSISPMRRRDLRRGVMPIEEVSHPRPWSLAVFESEIAQIRSGARHYIVARRDDPEPRGAGRGPIVGYAGVWFTDGDAHVTNIAVVPAQQRSGVASALMLALADESIRRGAQAWTLEVRKSSAGAQELYRRFGFVPAGVRARYYENTEDAIVMWCSEIQSDEYRSQLDSIRSALDERSAS